VIAANPELPERDLIKDHSIAVGFIDALRRRWIDADIARLAAHVGVHLLFAAYVNWLEAGDKADLALRNENVMSLLESIVPANATPLSSRQKSARVPANQSKPFFSPESGPSFLSLARKQRLPNPLSSVGKERPLRLVFSVPFGHVAVGR